MSSRQPKPGHRTGISAGVSVPKRNGGPLAAVLINASRTLGASPELSGDLCC